MQRETAMPLRLGQIIFAVMLAASPISAGAQVTIPTGGGGDSAAKLELTSPEAIREIISRMSDTEVREVLLERLDAVAAEAADREATADGGLLDFANRATVGVFKSVVHAISKTPLLIDYQSKSFATFFERLGASGIFFLCVVMAAAIAAGLIIEQIFYRVTRRWTNVAPVDGERSLRETIVFLFKRFLSDIAGVVVFYLAASTLGPLIGFNLAPVILGEGAPEIMPVIGDYIDGIWFNLIILPRLSIAATRFLISPSKPEYRLITTDDWSARFLHRHQAIFIFLVGFSAWIVTFNDMNGVPMGESRLGFWLNVAVHGYFAAMLWRAREGLTTMMRGADPDVTPGEERAAHYYPYIIVGITIAAWFMVEIIITYELWSLLAGAPQVKMFILLAYAPVMDAMVRGLVRHLTPPMTGEGVVAERAYLSAKRSYIRIGRIIAFAIVVVAIGQIWGIDFTNLATAGVGAQFAGRFIEILVVLALGYLFWELVSLWINRRLAAEQTAAGFDLTEEEPGGGEGGGIGGSRLSTVLPLLLGVMKVAIGLIFGLIALGNIGIDITPLLAGAGIIGLAVGFGAQKLVADVVSGIFFLVDDAFRTGEFVEVEGTMGTVEKISIRSMQLRHHKGPVHTIPYGEIPKITNYSRDWVIMKLKFTVPFETDPNKVKKLFKQIGKDMMEVPEFAEDLLQPFKSQGVFDFDDVGMIIRG